MSLLNYFRFVATGYLRKKRIIHGIRVQLLFRHDTEVFNPFQLLLDQYYKINGLDPNLKIQVDSEFSNLEASVPVLTDKKPKVSSIFKLKAGKVAIHRYVVSERKRSTSFYMVYLNEEPLAFLDKKYDYGKEFLQHISKISEGILDQSKMENAINIEDSLLLHNKMGQACYIEKFVHTHVFYVIDNSKFKKVCEEMSLNSIKKVVELADS